MRIGQTLVAMVALVLLVVGTLFAQTYPSTRPEVGENLRAAVIHIRGEVDDFSMMIARKHIERVRSEGGRRIIMQLDTPGGGLGATLDMTRYLRGLPKEGADAVEVVAYVSPMAYSAGTIIAVACSEIYMSPEAALGDCAPISVSNGQLQTLGDAERAKLASPVVADMYASAQRNGYDAELLAAMVLPGRVLHAVVSPEGKKRLVSSEEYADLLKTGWKALDGVPNPLDGADTLVTLDSGTAKRIGFIAGTYGTAAELAAAKGWSIQWTLEPTVGQRIVQWLNSAMIRGLLMTVFLITMYLSFQTPGHGLPEAVCMTALATLLVVPVLTGYASWVEILMVLLGIALIAAEIFVVTGTLVPGILGAVLVMSGLVLTFVPRELPVSPGEWVIPALPSVQGSWDALWEGVMVTTLAIVLAIGLSLWLMRYLPKLPVANRLVLTRIAGAGGVGSVLGEMDLGGREVWPPIGAVATAVSDLRPSGMAEFTDPEGPGLRTISVVSDSGFVSRGAKVRVMEVEGAHVVVREVKV